MKEGEERKGREWNIESRLNAGINSGVEASEEIIAIGIELALLIDVVFLIFVAYVVHAEENVDDGHCCYGFSSGCCFEGGNSAK